MDKWVRQLKNERNGDTTKATPLSAERRKIRALEKRIRRIEMEKEILKKATALLMSDLMNNLRYLLIVHLYWMPCIMPMQLHFQILVFQH